MEAFVLAPVLIPEVEDLQGDVISAEEIESAARDFMRNSQCVRTMHKGSCDVNTRVVESFILRSPTKFGSKTLPTGTWMVGVHAQGEVAERIRSGQLKGFSIGGHGVRNDFVKFVETSRQIVQKLAALGSDLLDNEVHLTPEQEDRIAALIKSTRTPERIRKLAILSRCDDLDIQVVEAE